MSVCVCVYLSRTCVARMRQICCLCNSRATKRSVRTLLLLDLGGCCCRRCRSRRRRQPQQQRQQQQLHQTTTQNGVAANVALGQHNSNINTTATAAEKGRSRCHNLLLLLFFVRLRWRWRLLRPLLRQTNDLFSCAVDGAAAVDAAAAGTVCRVCFGTNQRFLFLFVASCKTNISLMNYYYN